MTRINKRNLFLVLNLLSSLVSTSADDTFGIGTEVCFEGNLMDVFCIERETLFDNPTVKTLENPEAHSVHCLIDVESCIDSGYEILGDPAQEGDPYFRAYRFDDESNDQVVEYAKTVGVCTDCYGDGSIVKGLRATVRGVVTDLGDENTPPTIKTSFVGDSEVGCNKDTFGIGSEVCFEGNVMDVFCIERETLFDNPTVKTLENPEVHSVHCLIDVESCIDSGYEILGDPAQEGDPYFRAYRFDDESNDEFVEYAKTVGQCTDCYGEGTIEKGLRATVRGVVTDLGDESTPPTIKTSFIGSSDIGCGGSTFGVGSKVCIEGNVIDVFCIERETLFDNPTVKTLENPEVHSVHCLIDVESCIDSGYEMLADPTEEGGLYSRAYRFDDEGNEKVVDYAKTVGVCTDCYGNGTIDKGLRITVEGVVTDVGDENTPPTIQTTFIGSSDIGCEESDAGVSVAPPNQITGSGKNLVQLYLIHGGLMLAGWGLLLPSGAIIAKLMKHRPDGWWFKVHRVFQMLGLTLAIAAFVIAVRNFNSTTNHAKIGIVVMALGIFQPFNALIRPHNPEEGEEKTTGRKVWELLHRGVGWVAICLAAVTIVMGTVLLPFPEQQTTYQIVYGVVVFLLLVLTGFCMKDKNSA